MWLVYMIQATNGGRVYTGISVDMGRRLRQHNGLIKGGAKATRAGRPWALIYTERASTKGEALRRERALKRLTRAVKLELVYSRP